MIHVNPEPSPHAQIYYEYHSRLWLNQDDNHRRHVAKRNDWSTQIGKAGVDIYLDPRLFGSPTFSPTTRRKTPLHHLQYIFTYQVILGENATAQQRKSIIYRRRSRWTTRTGQPEWRIAGAIVQIDGRKTEFRNSTANNPERPSVFDLQKTQGEMRRTRERRWVWMPAMPEAGAGV